MFNQFESNIGAKMDEMRLMIRDNVQSKSNPKGVLTRKKFQYLNCLKNLQDLIHEDGIELAKSVKEALRRKQQIKE